MPNPSAGTIEFNSRFHSMFVAGPTAAGNPAHNIPAQCAANDFINSVAAVKNKAEAAIDGFTNPDAAAIVEGNKAHAAGRVTRISLNGHISHKRWSHLLMLFVSRNGESVPDTS